MIAYTGNFGSGKTLNIVKMLQEAHGSAVIVTNFNTSFSTIVINNFDDFLDFISFLYWEKSSKTELLNGLEIIIAIDEAQIWFDSRSFKKFPEEVLEYICQLRKLDTTMILSVQRPFMLDKNFRTFVEVWRNFSRPFSSLDKKILLDSGQIVKVPAWGIIGKWQVYRDYELSSEQPTYDQPLHKGNLHNTFMKVGLHKHYDSLEIVTKRAPDRKERTRNQWIESITRLTQPTEAEQPRNPFTIRPLSEKAAETPPEAIFSTSTI